MPPRPLIFFIFFAHSVYREIIFVRLSNSFIYLIPHLSFLLFIVSFEFIFILFLLILTGHVYSLFSHIHFFSVTSIFLSSFVLNYMHVVSFFFFLHYYIICAPVSPLFQFVHSSSRSYLSLLRCTMYNSNNVNGTLIHHFVNDC